MNAVSSSSECDQGALFTKEIHNMMHAFGDSAAPLKASVKLVESVLCKQMHSLVTRASEVTTMRGAKEIGIEDVLFLMRKDRVKIHRLLNYLVKHERNLRAELMTLGMDENRYLEYTSARRTSFTYRSGHVNKIQSWLQSSGIFPELPKVNLLLYQILAYLAYETVAQIVDLSLLVRQDGAAKPGDAFSYYVAGFTRMPGSYPAQHATEHSAKKVGGAPPITPAEIREALRRYWSPQLSPWSPFTRSLPSNLHTKLLMC